MPDNVYDETTYKGRPTVGFRSKWLIIFLFLKSFPFNQCCGSGSTGSTFLGLQDSDPDPLVRGIDPDPDPDPDPSIIM